MPNNPITAVCETCGKTFQLFLEQMAKHNQKVVCPECQKAKCEANDTGLGQSSN